MSIKLNFFGPLSEIVEQKIIVEQVADTNSLLEILYNRYPDLKQSKFSIAVGCQLISENKALTDGDELSFLPPFSGG